MNHVLPRVCLHLVAEHLRPDPFEFLRLAAVCREWYAVFTSDEVWRFLDPYGVGAGVASAFIERTRALPRSEQLNLKRAWSETIYKPSPTNNLDVILGYITWYDNLGGPIQLDLRQLMWCAVHIYPASLYYASVPLQDDAEIVGAAVRRNGHALSFASVALKQDFEIVKSAVCNQGRAISFAHDRLKRDPTLQRLAVLSDPMALAMLPEGSFDRPLALLAVELCGGALKHAQKFKSCCAVVLAAVCNDGNALRFAGTKTEEIVEAAVKQDGCAIAWAPEFQDCRRLGLLAVSGRGIALRHLSERLRDDDEIVQTATAAFENSIKYASQRLQERQQGPQIIYL